MSILTYRASNPRRCPDWRWQRAKELAAGSRLINGRDDVYTRELSKFSRLLDRCETEDDYLLVLDARPDLYEAYMLYDAQEVLTEHRWELEARILAQEPQADIQRKMGITPEIQDAFCTAFFDVRDRLQSPSLITHTIIGRAVQTGLAERAYDCLWKLFGYWCGPSVLDAVIYKFNNMNHVAASGDVKDALRNITKDTIELKGAVMMMTMPVGFNTRELVMTLWKDLIAMEVQAGHAGIGGDMVMQRVEMMTNTFHGMFTKYNPDIDQGNMSPQILEAEARGSRFRAAELAAIGMGSDTADFAHLLSSAQFPEQEDEK